jgi:serine protease Do
MNTLWTRRRYGPVPYALGALLGLSLGLLIVSGVFFFNSPRGDVTTPSEPAMGSDVRRQIDDSRANAIVRATQAVAPGVVNITATQTRVYRSRNPFSRQWLEFFGIPETYKQEIASLGSGVVVDPHGYILTNEHVVLNADVIAVTFPSGETKNAQVVDTAHDYDLAVIKVESDDLDVITLGDSDKLMVGEWAIAIGQPFGQLLYDVQPTVTVGVISALHRDVKESANSDQYFKDMIQTDAAINPGNSGGPLVNAEGEVIGINTFIFSSRDGGNLGMGFAIPINRGKWVLSEIREHGRIRDIWLGVHVTTLTPELAAGLNLESTQGLVIRQLDEGSPAEKADLKAGDVIVAVNGRKVTTSREANYIVYGSRIGDTLVFRVLRDGKEHEINVVLVERPNEI